MESEKAVSRLENELQPMGRLWRGIEKDLVQLGVTSLADLQKRDPEELFRAYSISTRKEYDLCVQDIFIALVAFAQTGKPRAWWRFTRDRSLSINTREKNENPLCAEKLP
jgi:hypothetical protein